MAPIKDGTCAKLLRTSAFDAPLPGTLESTSSTTRYAVVGILSRPGRTSIITNIGGVTLPLATNRLTNS